LSTVSTEKKKNKGDVAPKGGGPDPSESDKTQRQQMGSRYAVGQKWNTGTSSGQGQRKKLTKKAREKLTGVFLRNYSAYEAVNPKGKGGPNALLGGGPPASLHATKGLTRKSKRGQKVRPWIIKRGGILPESLGKSGESRLSKTHS